MLAFMIMALIVFGGIGLLLLLSGIALYNRLIRLRAAVDKARPATTKGRGKGDEARRLYEMAVCDYNTAIEAFPANIMARWFGLQKEDVQ